VIVDRRFAIFLCGAALAGFAGVVACGDDSAGAFYGNPNDNDPSSKGDGGGFGGAGEGVGQTSGVVLAHAAAFPAFRLCFKNLPELHPQPDSTVMPEANVVGVEIGSVVRIDPLKVPGTVYVVSERAIRATPGDNAPTCEKLICTGSSTCLEPSIQYLEAGEINEPLGQDRVHVLAITGCGSESFLAPLGLTKNDCDATWDSAKGALRARVIPLLPTAAANEKSLPVQLVHMSTPLEARRKTDVLDVSFGPIVDAGADAIAEQTVATAPTIFSPSAATTLQVDQANERFYGQYGFRVSLRSGGGDAGSDGGLPAGPASLVFDQTLADVQELSAPDSVPTSYYRVASNYALLLLGDPRYSRTFDDGGANPKYDPRRGLHFLAIPVKEPTDGGTGSEINPGTLTDASGQ
jgi:hypothetical protein